MLGISGRSLGRAILIVYRWAGSLMLRTRFVQHEFEKAGQIGEGPIRTDAQFLDGFTFMAWAAYTSASFVTTEKST